MKRALFQWFNLLMACVVLLSSTGFGLVEHSCQMRGKKKTMVVAFSDTKTKTGCAIDQQAMPAGQTLVKKTQCCQDDQQYENVDISSSLSQLVAKFIKTLTETIAAGVVTVLTWFVDWIFSSKSSSVSIFPSPPSLSGRDILTLVRSLLL
ncbi:hypothetical protein GO730_08905 [Spirosoma sp. HMF3257]|uniref:Uncharacterized protein n=1 Tax=Spirosoma telluris TaxID=2183553 RepID=A0A327NG86_9BACT|nr:hypothetical protein [Spirosoma telluris]RAI74371.1 hypothetical protein HMF3257_08820 [Spirosoma telluris]